MTVLGCLCVEFGITVLVCLSSTAQSLIKVTTMSNRRQLKLHSDYLDFTVSTCSEARLFLKTGIPHGKPDYLLKINHRMTQDSYHQRVVLKRHNVSSDAYTPVMSLNQSHSLCTSLEWLSVRIDKGLLIISEPCRQRKNFTWPVYRSNTKIFVMAELFSRQKASWNIAERPMCSRSTITGQGFFKAQSIELRTNKTQRRILNDHGFGFNDSEITALKINLQSCDLALVTFGESREDLFHDYYALFLNEHSAKVKTNITTLRRCRERTCTGVGSVAPSTAIKSCRSVQTFLIMMTPGEIGVGYACNKNSGLKWKIARNFKVRFVGLLSTSHNSYAEWDISFDSCQAPFRLSNKTTSHHVTVGHHEKDTPLQPSGHKPGVHVNPAIANSASNESAMADAMPRGNQSNNHVTGTDPRPVAGRGVTSGPPDGKDDKGLKGGDKEKQEIGSTTQQSGDGGKSRNSGWSPVMRNAEAWISAVLLSMALRLMVES